MEARTGMLAVAAAFAFGVLSVAAAGTFLQSAPEATSGTARATAVAPGSPTASGCLDEPTDARREKGVRWIEGLAKKLILPSDVAGRLMKQDPAVAQVVVATWAELEPIRDRPERLETAVRWLSMLSPQGLLVPSDVSGRLRSQDPELAAIVSAGWTWLACP